MREAFSAEATLREFLKNQFPGHSDRLRKAEAAWARRSAAVVVEQLRQLPPGDLAAFAKQKDERDFLRNTFPSVAEEVGQQEQTWGKRGAAQVVVRLTALGADDRAGFRKERARYQQLVEAFPAVRADLENAESAWGRRAASTLAGRLKALPAGSLMGFRKLRGEREELVVLLPALSKELRAAEWNWAGRTAEKAIAEVEPLLAKDPVSASLKLRAAIKRVELEGFALSAGNLSPREGAEADAVREKALAARRKAVQAGLEAARRQVKELVGKERYQAVARLAVALAEKLGPEAKDTGQQEELTRFRQSCDFLARLAREAGKTDPP